MHNMYFISLSKLCRVLFTLERLFKFVWPQAERRKSKAGRQFELIGIQLFNAIPLIGLALGNWSDRFSDKGIDGQIQVWDQWRHCYTIFVN